MKRIAVLSSGTDNCGINGAIRAVVRSAQLRGIRTYGVSWGFKGLLEDKIEPLSSRDVSGKLGKAGCFIGTTRPDGLLRDSEMQQVLANLNRKSIDGLIVIGGGGSFALSKKLVDRGVPVVGIPSTLQDDIPGTDTSIGVDTALNNIAYCVDHIRSCDSSRNRSFLVQVEGRESGSLALRAALTTGAEVCLIPEINNEELATVAKRMSESNMKGKTQCIAIISAGWKPGVNELTRFLQEHENETDLLVRKSILGYIQRGGTPSGFDRILASELGSAAIEALSDGISGHIVGLSNNKIVRVPYKDIVGKFKGYDKKMMEMFLETNK